MMKRFRSKFIKIFALCFSLYACESTDSLTPDIEQIMITELNTLRKKGCLCDDSLFQQVPPVSLNSTLTTAAVEHALDMSNRDYLNHISPEGISPEQRAQTSGYSGVFISENIAKGYATPIQVLNAWQDSPSHCAAMMNQSVTEVGVATNEGFWVLDMGKLAH